MPVSRTLTGATAEAPEPFELLRRLELLRCLDDATLEVLVEGLERVQLQKGQVLVRERELDDALYAVGVLAPFASFTPSSTTFNHNSNNSQICCYNCPTPAHFYNLAEKKSALNVRCLTGQLNRKPWAVLTVHQRLMVSKEKGETDA